MSIDNMDQQESLSGIFLNAVIVQIEFQETQKFGEAVVRIPEIHGDSTQTPDVDLPAALFYQKAFPASFGTFDVGDDVLVSFMNGDRNAPIIEGKVFNLDKVNSVVPEYSASYGKVKGIMSSNIKACIFFNEANETINIRFTNGSTIVIKEGSIVESTGTWTLNADTSVTVNSPKVKVASDNTTLTSTEKVMINAPMIQCMSDNTTIMSKAKVSISAPMISMNGM